MKKIFLPLVMIAGLATAQTGQVGINTENPKTTLDVVGEPTDTSKLDGITAPRLTGDQLAVKIYTADQTGALVYATAPAATLAGQVVNVSAPGYYYFDGSIWQTAGANFREKDTLYDVVLRGNYSPKWISFLGNDVTKQGIRDAALGVNPQTYSFFFGNMNPAHTGSNNNSFGFNALKNVTTAIGNVAFGGYTLSTNKVGNYNTALGAYAAEQLVGYKNTVIGNMAGSSILSGNHNVAVGYNAGGQGKFGTMINSYANTYVGTFSGLSNAGNFNVFIGFGAGTFTDNLKNNTVSNRLVIDSDDSLTGDSNTSAGNFQSAGRKGGVDTGLIIGDFSARWVKFNGTFGINPLFAKPDNTFTKSVVAKPDGTIGFSDNITVPAPPVTGSYVLQSVNGVTKWVSQ